MNRPFQRPNLAGMTLQQRHLVMARINKEFLTRMRQERGTGLVPRDSLWKAIDEKLLRIFGDVLFSNDRERILRQAVPSIVKQMPKLAEEVAELATANPELIKTYWLPRLLEVVAFSAYGMKLPKITASYSALLMKRQSSKIKKLTKQLKKRAGVPAVQSEANFTLVNVHNALADVSTHTIEDFHQYLSKVFRNNVLNALTPDDVSLPTPFDEKTPWGKKMVRRKKDSLDEVMAFDAKKVDQALKNISPPSPEDTLNSSGAYILALIPEGRLREVAILRYLEDLPNESVI